MIGSLVNSNVRFVQIRITFFEIRQGILELRKRTILVSSRDSFHRVDIPSLILLGHFSSDNVYISMNRVRDLL
jgi:hypothetical protein